MNPIDVFRCNGPGQVIWAITNVCNAKCNFCSYATGKGGKATYVNFETAKKVLDIMDNRNWKIVSFTGGEPLLNPDAFKIIAYAVQKGFITRSGTNGKVLSPGIIQKLKATGIRNFWISIDSEWEERHNANRGIPDLMEHVKKMIPYLKEAGIKVNAAVPVNKLVGDFTNLFDYLNIIGLDTVAFCYPMTVMEATYGGAAESELVEFTPEELSKVLYKIKELKEKRYRNMRVVNPLEGLNDIIDMQRGKESRFKCLGGYKCFYLDWNLTLFRCAYLAENYGNFLELDSKRVFAPVYCDKCMWQCFRDPAVYYHLLESLRLFKESLGKGNLKKAVNCLNNDDTRQSFSAWNGLIKDGFYK